MENYENIKLYRVVPDPFTSSTLWINPEVLYYYMGYTKFMDGVHKGYDNTLVDRINNCGKYFYFFPEDALLCSDLLVDCETAKIIEYSFNYKYCVEIAGKGFYEHGMVQASLKRILETFICKDNFSGKKCSSKNISDDLKVKAIIKSYMETLKLKNENCLTDEKIIDLLNNDSFNREYFQQFLNFETDLIKSDEITGNVWTIKNGNGWTTFSLTDENVEHLKETGLSLDYSKEANDFRDTIKQDVINGNYKKAYEKIRIIQK